MTLERHQFKAGEFLFREGEASYFFFMIDQGKVEIIKQGATNKDVPIAILGAGNAVGEFAMIDKKPRSASARALTDVVAYRVSEENYRKILSELPQWAIAMMTALVERLRNTNEILHRNGIMDEGLQTEIETAHYKSQALSGAKK